MLAGLRAAMYGLGIAGCRSAPDKTKQEPKRDEVDAPPCRNDDDCDGGDCAALEQGDGPIAYRCESTTCFYGDREKR